MRNHVRLIAVACIAAGTGLVAATTAEAQTLNTGWFTRVEVRQCQPGTAEDPRFVCSGNNPTLTDDGGFDLAESGSNSLSVISPTLDHQSAVRVGYDGDGRAPTISAYSYSAEGIRITASTYGFQRYEFLETDVLRVSATLTYSQTGLTSPQASRNPWGTLAGGVTIFQTDSDQVVPQDCPRWVDGGSDFSIPGSGNNLLLCLLFGDFAGVSNFQNFEFNPDAVPTTDGQLMLEFTIAGEEGDVWFLGTDMFAFARNGGFADSRTTLRVDIENPEIVQPFFDAGTFEPAPPLTVEAGIDFRPFSSRNTIRPNFWGLVPVAILGSAEFDALQVNSSTVRLGVGEAAALRWFTSAHDVNRDGFSDLIVWFKTRKADIQCGDTQIGLTGTTFDETPFVGTDVIKTIRCK